MQKIVNTTLELAYLKLQLSSEGAIMWAQPGLNHDSQEQHKWMFSIYLIWNHQNTKKKKKFNELLKSIKAK